MAERTSRARAADKGRQWIKVKDGKLSGPDPAVELVGTSLSTALASAQAAESGAADASQAEESAQVPVAQQNGHPPTPNGQGQDPENSHTQPNGQHPQHYDRRTLRHDSPIGPDEVYDQEADEAAYNEAMYPAHPDDPDRPTGNKEHVA